MLKMFLIANKEKCKIIVSFFFVNELFVQVMFKEKGLFKLATSSLFQCFHICTFISCVYTVHGFSNVELDALLVTKFNFHIPPPNKLIEYKITKHN